MIAWLAACTAPVVDTDEPQDTVVLETGAETGGDGPSGPVWGVGALDPLPALDTLQPLPGGAAGPPVFTSNNPETFTSTGFLYEVARVDPMRGGASHPLVGDFGVYLHHANGSGASKIVQLLVTNPTGTDLVVRGSGSAWTNAEEPLRRGGGPDYAVAEAALAGTPRFTVPATSVPSFKAASIWSASLSPGAYVDGRFALHTSAGAYVYTVVTGSADANEAVNLSQTAATGNVHPPGDPPPPYGREAGVYAADTWAAEWRVEVPGPGHYLGYAVNTATGTGFPQVQAFPALTRFSDSSAEAVGMYGNTYDLTVRLEPGEGRGPVDVVLASHGGGSPSFWWNGPVEVDGVQVPVWLAPNTRTQTLTTVSVDAPTSVRLRLFVPGLSSIPLGLYLVTR